MRSGCGEPVFCTIVARNYLAHARVLAASLHRHDPAARLDVLVLDDPAGDTGPGESFRVVRPPDVGLPEDEFLALATAYDTLELATSVKAALLRAELARHDTAVYLDPDVAVFDSLHGLGPLAAEHGIVVTPHCVRPVPRDGRTPDEQVFLRAGTFNLGFLAVGQGALPMLDWWDERLRRDCVRAVGHGLFVDQKWLDLAAGHFGLHVLTDPGYNVAYWNLHERPVRATDGGYVVGDVPLRFFHFSGYDVTRPHRLSRYAGERPRATLATQPAVRALCDWYRAELLAAGHDPAGAVPFGTTANGLRLDERMRRLYRAAKRAEADGGPLAPRPPFGTEAAEQFVRWLREPVVRGATGDVSRYAYQLWLDREDLRYHFADLYGTGSGRYVDWLRGPDAARVPLPPELVPDRPGGPRWPRPAALSPGVNVVGYLRAECGLGEAARGLVAALETAGVPHAVVPYTDTPLRQAHAFEPGPAPPHFAVTVTCVNADETPRLVERLGDQLLDGRWRVGMWAWEVDRVPAGHAAAAALLDEVWVGSEHTARAVRAAVDIPVRVFPLVVDVPAPPATTRAELGLPDGFLALFCFDFASVVGRKNPQAVIEAFRRAFPRDPGARLVVKTVGGDTHLDDLERLRLAAADDPRVAVVDGYRSREEHLALVASCDVYVSLHRCEGFGLTVAEAMALGRPVVATDYSSTAEFLDETTGWPVPYELVPVGQGHAPYPEDAQWAEPDVEAAARVLREIRDDPAAAAARAAAGRALMRTRYRPGSCADFLRERVAEALRARVLRDQPRPAPPPEPEPAPAPDPAAAATADTVRFLLANGPDVDAPARSKVSHAARKLATRAIDNYVSHQRRVDELLTELLTAADARHTAAGQRLDTWLGSAVTELRDAVTELHAAAEADRLRTAARFESLERRVAEVLDELSAEPYRADPSAFRVVDDGAVTLGYDDDGRPEDEAYAWFSDAFRGSEALVAAQVREYLPLLRDAAPVFEVGPGRGELLTLLRDAGVEARGVELDRALAARCRTRGLDVERGDAITALQAAAPGTYGAVVAIELIEHLDTDRQHALLCAATRALRRGGLLLLETVNAHSPRALKAFWLDPTHVRPLYPEGLLTLVRQHGFASARVRFTGGTGDLRADRLRCGGYAVVARAR